MRKIVFPKIRIRTYGYNSTSVTGTPYPDAGVNVGKNGMPLRGRNDGGASLPGSRRNIGGDSSSDGRSYLGNTQLDLQSGVAPDRINRNTRAQNMGTISVSGEPIGMGGWPYDGNALYMPHQRIPRTPITVSPFSRTIDTGVTIPAIGIGNPIG